MASSSWVRYEKCLRTKGENNASSASRLLRTPRCAGICERRNQEHVAVGLGVNTNFATQSSGLVQPQGVISVFIFMEVNGLQVQHEFFCVIHLALVALHFDGELEGRHV